MTLLPVHAAAKNPLRIIIHHLLFAMGHRSIYGLIAHVQQITVSEL
jgi:hypothetical protein